MAEWPILGIRLVDRDGIGSGCDEDGDPGVRETSLGCLANLPLVKSIVINNLQAVNEFLQPGFHLCDKVIMICLRGVLLIPCNTTPHSMQLVQM